MLCLPIFYLPAIKVSTTIANDPPIAYMVVSIKVEYTILQLFGETLKHVL